MRKLTKVLRKHLLFIIMFVLIVELCLAVGVYFLIPDRYESTAILLVSRMADDLNSESYELDNRLLDTYKEICTKETVLQAAIAQAGVEMDAQTLKKRVRIENTSGTNIVNITAWSNDAEISAKLANGLSDALISSVREGFKIENLQVIQEAKPAPQSSFRYFGIILGLGFFAALLLAILFVCIREYYDDTLRSVDQISEIFGKPVIGQIPHGITRLRRR